MSERTSRIRKSIVMQLKPGKQEEYRASHNEGFWPEMGIMLKAHGAHNYHIALLEESNLLFAYVEIENEELWAKVKDTEICKKWWAWMEEYIVFNPDHTPFSTPLKEMFFLA